MRALDFAGSIRNGSMKFGTISREETIEQLRAIADRIEKNEKPKLILQAAYSCDKVLAGDFVLTTLVLEFAEISPDAPKGTELVGPSRLAVEVQGLGT